jgi:UDP-N-acetylmuramate--alanine ligase
MSSWRKRRLHFVAVGGAGMSGLALVSHELGARVSGSDRADSSYMRRLREAGLEPALGHAEENLPEDAEVVVSTAVSEDNPELALARRRGQRVMHRGELLAELCGEKRLIAVAGSHGKTTTTAMIVWALRESGADPAWFLGGELPAVSGGRPANAAWGMGEWAVAEADESDASFLRLRPEVAVVTNVEMDHHARWSSLASLRAAFQSFVGPAAAVALPGDPALAPLGEGRRSISFAEDRPGPANLELAVPGRHNLLNARAALAGLELAGFEGSAAAKELTRFPGVRRRLELKGRRSGARIFDDYGHHPTEVRAALEALRSLEPRRLLAVFQPHLYSRTKVLAERFGAALAVADEVGVLEVYPAREEPVGDLAGVSGLQVASAAADRSEGRPVWWLRDIDTAAAAIPPLLDEGDIVVTIGAGDVHELADRLVEEDPA